MAARLDGVVATHLSPVPERLRAVRLYLLVLIALFTVVTIVCLLTGAWVLTVVYAVLATGSAAFRRRFLR